MSSLEKNIPQIDDQEHESSVLNDTGIEKSDEQRELEKKLDNIEGSLKYLSGYGSSLDKGTKKLAKNIEDEEDKNEIIILNEKLENLKQKYTEYLQDGKLVKVELDELKNGIQNLQQSVDSTEFNSGIEIDSETGEKNKNEISQEKLKTITNHEFLKITPENRLQYITKNHIDSESILNGVVTNINFTFTFDGKFNKELYSETTAGQVLPEEVMIINIGGKNYERIGLNGEFYNLNKRLVIKEGTKIDINKIGTKEELASIKEENNKLVDNFIVINPDYTNYRDKVEFIVNEGIDAKYIKIIGLDEINNFDEVKLEKFTTDIGREREFFKILDKKEKLPKNYVDFEKVIELSKTLRMDYVNKSNLNDEEKIKLVNDTSKMSIGEISNYIEQNDNIIGKTGINYENNLSTYTGKIDKDPKGLTGRLRLRDVVPNTHIELNEHYNKYNIENVPENKRDDALRIIESMPEGWAPIVCRNAIKNPNFSSNKPFIAQNLTYKTAVIYFPGREKADIIPINHGAGIGGIGEVSNVNGSHGTSLGSKELVAQGGGKYKYRLVVKGLEPLVEKFKFNRGEAMNHDPEDFGNSNDESRVIRIHETKESHRTTWGCSGLEAGNAKKLYDAIKSAGGGAQEIFVSKV